MEEPENLFRSQPIFTGELLRGLDVLLFLAFSCPDRLRGALIGFIRYRLLPLDCPPLFFIQRMIEYAWIASAAWAGT